MRRLFSLLFLLLLLLVVVEEVRGYGNAPGTYPDEEMKNGSEFEVPKNPYESGWTGYEYYYEKEKEPKKPSSSVRSGKMPAFQSIESVSSDREGPDDPEGYVASGSESSGKPRALSTTTTRTTTSAPSTDPPVKVAPNSTAGTSSTSTPTSTHTITSTTPPKIDSRDSPESGTDFTAPEHDLYSGDQKDATAKNLLTTLIEKKKNERIVSRTRAPEGYYDSVDDATGYGGAEPMERKPSAQLKSADSYDDLGGPSGYGTTSGSAPGASPRGEITTPPPPPTGPQALDYGQGGSTTRRPKSEESLDHLSGYGAGTSGQNHSKNHGAAPDYGQKGSESKKTTTSEESLDVSTHLASPGAEPTTSKTPVSSENHPNPYTAPEIPVASRGVPKSPIAIALQDSGNVYGETGPGADYPDPPENWPKIPGGHVAHYKSGSDGFDVPVVSRNLTDRIDDHIGSSGSKFAPGSAPTVPPSTSNSNNAISPRDPYDHFGTAPAPRNHQNNQRQYSDEGFEDEHGYYGDGNAIISVVPDRHSNTRHPSIGDGATHTDLKAQISEIDRIAEYLENSAREPVEYEQKITSESSKGITVEAGKQLAKHFGRKARKCCSCCDEKQPVSRQVETKVEPSNTQQLVDATRSLGEDPEQHYVPLQSTVGGSAYVQPQPIVQPQQTLYQQPFQQYRPQYQYPQSYPQQASCGCQPQPQNCCAPPQPCCLPTIPCCPPIPCCPQPKICCQPQPICLPPPTCCSINFQVPTIPICGRACPSCPCRRRVHRSRRLKRHSISTNCNQCSAAGEPWKSVLHHREKRAASGCSSGFSTLQQNSCGSCGASNLRSPRVKRMGCLPCLGRKKRNADESSHIRVKRMGCLPCLGGGRKKRSALSNCSQCNSLGHLFNRYKRSLFGCSPCASQPACPCQGRKKRSVTMRVVKRAPIGSDQCDATCCDYSKCQNRHKKESLVPFTM
ncbi:unnamed protein product [Caenorhabditis sp. 36 PRJEB53466]|nr:unnamed protein product [Caenorhabditis sp. 36 PRJEB53466]